MSAAPLPAQSMWSAARLGEYLDVSEDTVVRRTQAEGWPHHRVGKQYRFSGDDVAAIDDLTAVSAAAGMQESAEVTALELVRSAAVVRRARATA
jgi:excisionase family DNA binding protein